MVRNVNGGRTWNTGDSPGSTFLTVERQIGDAQVIHNQASIALFRFEKGGAACHRDRFRHCAYLQGNFNLRRLAHLQQEACLLEVAEAGNLGVQLVVMVSKATPVFVFVSFIFAPATTPCEESVTIPERDSRVS